MEPKNILIICLSLLGSTTVYSQTVDSNETKSLGFIFGIDVAYNSQDKVLSPGLGRKWTLGLSMTNAERDYIGYIAAGLKGFKVNVYSPTFRESFINDVQQNYVPIIGTSLDSLIGAKMNSDPKKGLWGTYAQYLELGFILNKRLKPSFSFYAGYEYFLLHDRGFTFYEDPVTQDIDYVSMRTIFYEAKVGCAIPVRKFEDKPFSLNLNVGYKWVDYGDLKFKDTPLSVYTNGSLNGKYRTSGKLTLSVCYIIWTNW